MNDVPTGPMVLPVVSGPEIHDLSAQARAQHWYALSPFGFPVFLRYRDCDRLSRDPRFREVGLDLLQLSGVTEGPLYEWYALIMFANDGETHRRLRGLVSKAFTPTSIEAARPMIRQHAADLCRKLDGEFDLARDVAHWMPVLAVSSLLGIPAREARQFGEWSARLGAIFSVFITADMRVELDEALETFTTYVRALIADRRANPRDDLTTALIDARDGGDGLSEDELVAMIANLVIGGHDATERLITNAMWLLLRHPDQWQALRADSTLAVGAVEEVLRFEPPSGGVARVALDDVDWGVGLRIAAGSMVASSAIAANRDPEVFAESDRFDIRRPDARHLTFGGGPHFCLGAALGRVVAQETLRALAQLPLELADDAPAWAPPERGFRGITRLVLTTSCR